MYLPVTNTNFFRAFYMGSDPSMPKPGLLVLEIRKNGIKLRSGFRKLTFIKSDRMINTKLSYNVGTGGPSAGGALIGGMLAGEVSAIAGAASGRGKKTVDSFITLAYKDESNTEHKLTFNSDRAEKLKKRLDSKYQLAA